MSHAKPPSETGIQASDAPAEQDRSGRECRDPGPWKCIGSNFDDFLREERILEEVRANVLIKLRKLNLKRWDIVDHLSSLDEIVGYLKACLALKDQNLIQGALADAERARITWKLPDSLSLEEVIAGLPAEEQGQILRGIDDIAIQVKIQRERRFDAMLEAVVIERCPDTGLFVGHVPGIAGAHTQGATPEEMQENLREVLALQEE